MHTFIGVRTGSLFIYRYGNYGEDRSGCYHRRSILVIVFIPARISMVSAMRRLTISAINAMVNNTMESWSRLRQNASSIKSGNMNRHSNSRFLVAF